MKGWEWRPCPNNEGFFLMRVKEKYKSCFFFVQQSWSCTLRPLAHIIEEGTLFCDRNNVHFTDRCDSFDRSHEGHLCPAGRSNHHINNVVLSCCQSWLKCLLKINYVTWMTHMLIHTVYLLTNTSHLTWVALKTLKEKKFKAVDPTRG